MELLLDPAARPVIAHRGASAHAPENTLPAFELALRQGADALELDVHVTSDGVAVVIHDDELERTTDLAGTVSAHTLAGLRKGDAGCRFSPDGGKTYPFAGQGIRIPTLAEVLATFPDTPVLIDVKAARTALAVRQTLLDQKAWERCVVESMDDDALVEFDDPRFRRAATSDDVAALYSAALLGRPVPPHRYRCCAVPERYRGLPVPTQRFVALAREHGLPVHVWTVNDPVKAERLWKRGVSGIITDRPDALKPAPPPPP